MQTVTSTLRKILPSSNNTVNQLHKKCGRLNVARILLFDSVEYMIEHFLTHVEHCAVFGDGFFGHPFG